MAWIPFALAIAKTAYDETKSESGDDAARQAGAAKLAAMRQGAGQIEGYRAGYPEQRLRAMQNQMGAYSGAQNVLSQMYGGHANDMQRMGIDRAVQNIMRQRGNPAFYGARPGMPGGPMSGAAPANVGPAAPPSMPSPNIGFGGEVMPPPFRRM